jgi:hypothetical protein
LPLSKTRVENQGSKQLKIKRQPDTEVALTTWKKGHLKAGAFRLRHLASGAARPRQAKKTTLRLGGETSFPRGPASIPATSFASVFVSFFCLSAEDYCQAGCSQKASPKILNLLLLSKKTAGI